MNPSASLRARRGLAIAAAFWTLGWGCRSTPEEKAAPAPASAPAAAPAPQGFVPGPTEIKMEWKGSSSGISSPYSEVVADPAAWQALWKKAFGKDAPETDFNGRYAVAVFLGAKPTGGYSVDFFAPISKDGKTQVPYRVNRPGKGSFVTQAFTSPWAIRLFEGDAKGVEPVPAP